MNQALANFSLEDLAEAFIERTTVFSEAAEILDVHPTYARRMVIETAEEGADLIYVHGHPIISRTFLNDLNESRREKAAERERKKVEAAEQAVARAAERAEAKAAKAAELEQKAQEKAAADAEKAAKRAEAAKAKAKVGKRKKGGAVSGEAVAPVSVTVTDR